MTKCNCCNKIKFDFQFPSESYWWLATENGFTPLTYNSIVNAKEWFITVSKE